jgi:hypothetical protein
MSRFAVLKPATAGKGDVHAPAEPSMVAEQAAKPIRQDRADKKMVGGYFSKELSKAVNMLAIEQETTVQALVGEALDLLLRHHGKHPHGER